MNVSVKDIRMGSLSLQFWMLWYHDNKVSLRWPHPCAGFTKGANCSVTFWLLFNIRGIIGCQKVDPSGRGHRWRDCCGRSCPTGVLASHFGRGTCGGTSNWPQAQWGDLLESFEIYFLHFGRYRRLMSDLSLGRLGWLRDRDWEIMRAREWVTGCFCGRTNRNICQSKRGLSISHCTLVGSMGKWTHGLVLGST